MSELIKVCEEEREALKLGDFDRLASFQERKEAAIIQLNQVSLGERDIKVAQAEVERSQRMLSAALDGLGSAREIMRPMAEKDTISSIYTKTGLRQNLPR